MSYDTFVARVWRWWTQGNVEIAGESVRLRRARFRLGRYRGIALLDPVTGRMGYAFCSSKDIFDSATGLTEAGKRLVETPVMARPCEPGSEAEASLLLAGLSIAVAQERREIPDGIRSYVERRVKAQIRMMFPDLTVLALRDLISLGAEASRREQRARDMALREMREAAAASPEELPDA